MQKPSALLVSVAIAFFLFSPIACFSEQQQSHDCCGYSTNLDCPFGRLCQGGVCAGCVSDLDCVFGARCVDGACM